MKITERKLQSMEYIKGGHEAECKMVTINGVTHTLEVVYKTHHMETNLYVDKVVVETEEEAYTKFKELTGMDLQQFEKYLGIIHYRNMEPCCKKHSNWVNGFPGESLLMCDICHKVHDTHFSLSAII